MLYKQVPTALIFFGLMTSALSAAPRVSELKAFTEKVAKESGKSEEVVRSEMLDVLRTSGKYSESDLLRIGRGEVIIRAKEQLALRFLEESADFRVKFGIKAMVVPVIHAEAGAAFDVIGTSPVHVIDPKQVDAVGRSLGDFSHILLKELDSKAAATGGNVFFSPFGIAQALMMTATGAGGRTEAQMLGTLKLSQTAAKARDGWQGLLESLRAPDSGVQLKSGNSIWVREDFKLESEFKKANEQAFGAQVASLDFSRPDSADTINRWVSDATGGKIRYVLSSGPIPSDVVSYLVSGVWFKGSWSHKFNPRFTKLEHFYLDNAAGTVRVPMMVQRGKMYYAAERRETWRGQDELERGIQYLRMPYGKEGRFAMEFVLPPKGQKVGDLVSKLDRVALDALASQASYSSTDVSIPRFKAEYEEELSATLKSLGITDAFSSQAADFRKMGAGPLFISMVKHKAVVEVNEEGASAAAATVVEVQLERYAPSNLFVADRPFFYAIRDMKTGAILFSGVMRNPTL